MSGDALIRRPDDFPPEVHASLAKLRTIAKAARSRKDPGLRWASDDEIALAVSLLKPWMCGARSSRSGLPCERPRLAGATVCRTHGAGTKEARAAANRRLQAMVMPMLERQRQLAMQKDNLAVAQKATTDLLDRNGLGLLAEAKIRQSLKDPGGVTFDAKIHIVIPSWVRETPTRPRHLSNPRGP